jgi:two-component system response regulator YesN
MPVNVLLVDDEIHWLEGLSETIPWESLGIDQVFKAQNGFEALLQLGLNPIDIVVTDVLMPEMTGIELIEQIRTTWGRIKCIVLSGYAEFDYAQMALSHHAFDYLLKPVRDEVLIEAVSRAVSQLKEEWELIANTEQTAATLRENLPLLKGNLLEGLLAGQSLSKLDWDRKKEGYHLNFDFGTAYSLMMIRLEGRFIQLNDTDISLIEYSVINIAEEIFDLHFSLWHCRDKYGYLVFVVMPHSYGLESNSNSYKQLLRQCAMRLQRLVNVYLKGTVSVLLSEWGTFPENLGLYYHSVLNTFRQLVGEGQEAFVGVANDTVLPQPKRMVCMYEPPRIVHLLEAGRWTELVEKLEALFEELNESFSDSQEHVMEAGYEIAGAFFYMAHKKGQRLSVWIGTDYEKLANGTLFRSIRELRQWSYHVIETMKKDIEKEMMYTRSDVIHKLHRYVETHLADDLSLQALADQVYLHPTHLSKLYKSETGEVLSSYLHRYRMEKAAHLLSGSEEKIYRIGGTVGYPHAAYFIKVFKKYFGLTPQEYRDGKRLTK